MYNILIFFAHDDALIVAVITFLLSIVLHDITSGHCHDKIISCRRMLRRKQYHIAFHYIKNSSVYKIARRQWPKVAMQPMR